MAASDKFLRDMAHTLKVDVSDRLNELERAFRALRLTDLADEIFNIVNSSEHVRRNLEAKVESQKK